MNETLILVVLVTLLGVGTVAVQVVNFLNRRRWAAHDHYPFFRTEWGFEPVRDRFLVDTRIQVHRGERHGRPTEVEVGAGPNGVYVRVDFEFDQVFDLGLRISSEHEDGMLTRLMRMREIEIGHKGFDSQFILLARDDERLKELLDRDVRRMLLDLRDSVRDLRLADDGLHLQFVEEVPEEELKQLIDRGAQLASAVFTRTQKMVEQRKEDEQMATGEAFVSVTGSMPAVTSTTEGR